MAVVTAPTTTGAAGTQAASEASRDRLPLWDYIERSGLSSLVFGTSKDPNAKLTVVLFSARSGKAVCAVKAPTTDAAARAVEHELDVLHRLRSHALAELGATIPRVIEVVQFGRRPAAVMSAVDGVPMSTSYMRGRHTARPARVAADFAAVGRWLQWFQAITASGRSVPLDMDAGVRTRLRSRFPDEPLDAALAALAEIHGRLHQQTVCETAVHGDLWMGNILMSNGRVSGVVDWEAAATRGQPVRDLARFALIYALYLDRRTRPGRRVSGHAGLRASSWGAGVRYALDGSGWFPDLFRAFLQDGMARLGAARSSWRDAVLAAIAEVAGLTDDDEFARRNLHLFAALAPTERPVRRRHTGT
jgi:aminoglycoside phosphotransferase (APT) family kinase protein